MRKKHCNNKMNKIRANVEIENCFLDNKLIQEIRGTQEWGKFT